MNNPIREEEVKIYDEIHRANKMKSTPQPEQPKAAFTPGPWDYFKHTDGSISIMGDTDGADLHVAAMLYTGFPEAVEANARLIAQSPSLYAMLGKVLDRCDDLHCRELMEWDSDTTELFNQARAIIARAKGEE